MATSLAEKRRQGALNLIMKVGRDGRNQGGTILNTDHFAFHHHHYCPISLTSSTSDNDHGSDVFIGPSCNYPLAMPVVYADGSNKAHRLASACCSSDSQLGRDCANSH